MTSKGELCSSGEPSTTHLDRPLLDLVRGSHHVAAPAHDYLNIRLPQVLLRSPIAASIHDHDHV